MLLALTGLVFGGDTLFLATTDAKDTAHFSIDIPLQVVLKTTDAKDKARFALTLPYKPNDATDTSSFTLYVRYLLTVLPLLRVQYGCTYDEDFTLTLRFSEVVQTASFSLTIGQQGSVATVAGVIQPDQMSVMFHVPAASGPSAWVNTGAGGKGPGTYLMELLVTEGVYTRQILVNSSFDLGESIFPEVDVVSPSPQDFFRGIPFPPNYDGPPPFPLSQFPPFQ